MRLMWPRWGKINAICVVFIRRDLSDWCEFNCITNEFMQFSCKRLQDTEALPIQMLCINKHVLLVRSTRSLQRLWVPETAYTFRVQRRRWSYVKISFGRRDEVRIVKFIRFRCSVLFIILFIYSNFALPDVLRTFLAIHHGHNRT